MTVYEIAQQLIKEGEEVDFLTLLDTDAHIPNSANITKRLRYHLNSVFAEGIP